MPRMKSDLVDNVFNEIVMRINHYTYVAGDPVSEIAISSEFNVSRTPVREAILRLIDIGLLVRDKSKVVVKSLNLNDINEILEARLALEIMSVRIILDRGGLTKEEYQEITSIHKSFYDSLGDGDFEKNFELDTKLHSFLIKCSKNSRLEEFAYRLNVQSDRFRHITILTPSRHSMSNNEHEDIINAIHEKDLEKSIQALMTHTANSKNNYQTILNNDMWIKMIKTLKV